MGKCLSCLSKSHPDFEDRHISLRQFELLRSVGRGAFGKVRIVRKKSDKQLYALKYINKAKCIQQKAVRNTVFERNLLIDLDHPLIVNLRYAFQDEENMFMVLDLMLGGDLKYHLQQTGSFPEEAVRIWAAEMICAIEYLHEKGVVHRDIKPDNLLLDAKGHIHLTDFNVATYLPSDGSKLESFSGTLAYMAPEVITRRGYREGVDWWGMGVVIYELLFGKRPFRGRSSKEIASRIVKTSIIFPTSRHVSQECYDFIMKVLRKRPEERLGHGGEGVQRLKDHPWLAGICWEAVSEKKLQSIFVPDPERPNFNALFEAEDVLMEDKPLKSHHKSSSKHTALTPDEDYIQKTFGDFDFRQRDVVALQKTELLKTSMEMEAEKTNQWPMNNFSGSSRLTLRDVEGEGEHPIDDGEGDDEDEEDEVEDEGADADARARK